MLPLRKAFVWAFLMAVSGALVVPTPSLAEKTRRCVADNVYMSVIVTQASGTTRRHSVQLPIFRIGSGSATRRAEARREACTSARVIAASAGMNMAPWPDLANWACRDAERRFGSVTAVELVSVNANTDDSESDDPEQPFPARRTRSFTCPVEDSADILYRDARTTGFCLTTYASNMEQLEDGLDAMQCGNQLTTLDGPVTHTNNPLESHIQWCFPFGAVRAGVQALRQHAEGAIACAGLLPNLLRRPRLEERCEGYAEASDRLEAAFVAMDCGAPPGLDIDYPTDAHRTWCTASGGSAIERETEKRRAWLERCVRDKARNEEEPFYDFTPR